MQTIPEILLAQVDTYSNAEAIYVKRDGCFVGITWQELQTDIRRYAAIMVGLGAQHGDRVVQFCENRYEWILVDLALQLIGAIHVPVHSTLSGTQVIYQTVDSGAQLVLLSGEPLAAELEKANTTLPTTVRIYSFDPVSTSLGGKTIERFDSQPGDEGVSVELEATVASRLGPDTIATILYTSGTTGEPKGVVLNQRNIVSNSSSANAKVGQTRDDLRLNMLPLSHIYARTCDLYSWILDGSRLALAEGKDTVIADCQAVNPTVMNAVPYFYGRLRKFLTEKGIQDQPGALIGLMGGAVRMCCSGGAPLPPDLYDYFKAQNVPLLQGYGLTESSPVIAASSIDADRRGAVGQPIDHIEVRIAEDGEILTRGDHVMVGYWQNQAATDEVIQDGWLHTGDLGHLDDDNFLFITGRKKELIVTATGKNIAPAYLEALLTEEPLILQAMIVGDNRKFLSALIVPDRELLARELGRDLDSDALNSEPVITLIQQRIAGRLADVAHYEQIGRFSILSRPFSIEAGELTAKLSLRRTVIAANYQAEIEAMYPSS